MRSSILPELFRHCSEETYERAAGGSDVGWAGDPGRWAVGHSFIPEKGARAAGVPGLHRTLHPREVLAEMFWEERTQAQALSNLRVALDSLRQTGGRYVEITRETVGVRPRARLAGRAGVRGALEHRAELTPRSTCTGGIFWRVLRGQRSV